MAYYLFNTRRMAGTKVEQAMLKEHKAIGCCGHHKKVFDIEKNDVVFLYRDDEGIIAYGVASGKTKAEDTSKWKGECDGPASSHKLANFRSLTTAIQANTITALKRNFGDGKSAGFRGTKIRISDEMGPMLKAIARLVEKRN